MDTRRLLELVDNNVAPWKILGFVGDARASLKATYMLGVNAAFAVGVSDAKKGGQPLDESRAQGQYLAAAYSTGYHAANNGGYDPTKEYPPEADPKVLVVKNASSGFDAGADGTGGEPILPEHGMGLQKPDIPHVYASAYNAAAGKAVDTPVPAVPAKQDDSGMSTGTTVMLALLGAAAVGGVAYYLIGGKHTAIANPAKPKTMYFRGAWLPSWPASGARYEHGPIRISYEEAKKDVENAVHWQQHPRGFVLNGRFDNEDKARAGLKHNMFGNKPPRGVYEIDLYRF